jgi:hypothetical protein
MVYPPNPSLIIHNFIGSIKQKLYLIEDIFHGHEEANSVIETEFVVFITATGEYTAHISQ